MPRPIVSDYAAMRGARMLAAADDRVEIWRGIHCIYQDKYAAETQQTTPYARR
jgi:hypothetical protein